MKLPKEYFTVAAAQTNNKEEIEDDTEEILYEKLKETYKCCVQFHADNFYILFRPLAFCTSITFLNIQGYSNVE